MRQAAEMTVDRQPWPLPLDAREQAQVDRAFAMLKRPHGDFLRDHVGNSGLFADDPATGEGTALALVDAPAPPDVVQSAAPDRGVDYLAPGEVDYAATEPAATRIAPGAEVYKRLGDITGEFEVVESSASPDPKKKDDDQFAKVMRMVDEGGDGEPAAQPSETQSSERPAPGRHRAQVKRRRWLPW